MEIAIKQICGICKGALVCNEYLTHGPAQGGGLVLTEVPCACTTTSTPGFYLVGTADFSDLADQLNDIMDKCNDIFEKVSE